jgi:ATP adenylyltransferase/5',5'''-P-1,P-4-tetraphosphate phosphorylase II
MNEQLHKVIISEQELVRYGKITNLSESARLLLAHQKENWELCGSNYKSLQQVQSKRFEFDGFVIQAQFNPARMRSSAAKVDKKSIEERKCFLCYNHLPEVQRGISFRDEYLLLCNPFPIFSEHFTIPKNTHTPQLIEPNFKDMLELSKALEQFVVFYNGPKCGASAPDHMHFQAGNKFFMPIDTEYQSVVKNLGEPLWADSTIRIYAVEKYIRKFISFESDNAEAIQKYFLKIYSKIAEISPNEEEPMLNILASWHENHWRVIAFPRGAHRPHQFFAEGDANILLSPASVDFGGVCILPQEKDFNKITHDDLIDIFAQVSISTEKFALLKKVIKS